MSSEHTPRIYSKEELRRMSLSRLASDTALLNVPDALGERGDYEGYRLAPTKPQIDAIWDEHEKQTQVNAYVSPESTEHAPQKIGHQVIVLHNAAAEELEIPAEDILQGEINRRELLDKVQAHIESYQALYSERIPSASTNRRNILGKLKTDTVALKLPEDQKPVGNFDAAFSTTIYYKPGETQNTLEKVSIRTKRRGEADPNPKEDKFFRDNHPILNLGYSRQEGLSSIELGQVYDASIYRGLVNGIGDFGDSIGVFVAEVVGTQAPRFSQVVGCNIRVELTGAPSVYVYERSAVGDESDNATPMCEYRYEPVQNEFKLFATDGYVRPTTMSVEDYLELVDGMLQLVPVSKIKLNA